MPVVTQNSGDKRLCHFESGMICTVDEAGKFHWYSHPGPGTSPDEQNLFTMISDGCNWYAIKDNNRRHSVRILFSGKELHLLLCIPKRETPVTLISPVAREVFILTFSDHCKTLSRGFSCGYCRMPVHSGETVIQEKGVEYHETCFQEFKSL